MIIWLKWFKIHLMKIFLKIKTRELKILNLVTKNIWIYNPWAHKRLSFCCRSSISTLVLLFRSERNKLILKKKKKTQKTHKIPPNSDYMFKVSFILYYMIHSNNHPFFCVEKFNFFLFFHLIKFNPLNVRIF